MPRDDLLQRVVVESGRCGARPCIRGTRIDISIILDSLVEGLDTAEIIREYPVLQPDDVKAAIVYAAELARENTWKLPTGS